MHAGVFAELQWFQYVSEMAFSEIVSFLVKESITIAKTIGSY